MSTEKKAKAVKRKHSARLLSAPGISGVGVEKRPDGEFVIAIHANDEAKARASLDAEDLDGVPVQVILSGHYRKQ